MRISSRFKRLWILGAAITMASCAATLPEAPRVLGPDSEQPDSGGSLPGGSAEVETTKEFEIKVLHKANFNPFELDNGKSFRMLQTVDAYRSELARHSIETPKDVDFSTHQVLVSSAGEKPTGGYKISVTKIEETQDNVVITVVQSIPGPACINTQGKTHPYEFVLVPSLKPIEIFERQRVENC